MKKITFCHFGRYQKDSYYRIYNLAFYSAKLNNVTLYTSNPKFTLFIKTLKLRANFKIILFPSLLFPCLIGKTGFGIFNTVFRIFHILIDNPQIVYSDSNQRFTSGIPCYVSKLINKSEYYAEWWDYYGKGGLYDYKKGIKRILAYYEHYSEVPLKKSVDYLVVLSSFMYRRAINLGIKENKLILIPGGSDIENIPFFPRNKFKNKYGFNPKSFVFGFIGVDSLEINDILNFVYTLYELITKDGYKNIEWFTTGESIRTHIPPEIKLGPEYHHFNYLTYHQYTELLSCSDCLLALLRDNILNQARWPNKLGDYFAAGRPILTSKVGEIKNLSSYLLPGLFMISLNKDEIKTAIINLVCHTNLDYLGETNRNFAVSHLSWENRSQKLPFN